MCSGSGLLQRPGHLLPLRGPRHDGHAGVLHIPPAQAQASTSGCVHITPHLSIKISTIMLQMRMTSQQEIEWQSMLTRPSLKICPFNRRLFGNFLENIQFYFRYKVLYRMSTSLTLLFPRFNISILIVLLLMLAMVIIVKVN